MDWRNIGVWTARGNMSKCRMVSLNSKYRIRKVVMRDITGGETNKVLLGRSADMFKIGQYFGL